MSTRPGLKINHMKCVIIDDEPLAVDVIESYIQQIGGMEIVAKCHNPLDAIGILKKYEVDLVFLDIEMPILSGFALLDDLTLKPQIIFVTGKTKYAFKAFDYDAVDYLRKPISKERFLNAVHKAVSNFKMKNDESFDENDFICFLFFLEKLLKVFIHFFVLILFLDLPKLLQLYNKDKENFRQLKAG